MSVFYDRLVNIHELHIEFDRLELPVPERNELIKIADSTIHHEVFDLIMIELPKEHKVYFLEIFSSDPADPKILDFLKEKIPGFEDKVKARATQIKEELAKHVRKIK